MLNKQFKKFWAGSGNRKVFFIEKAVRDSALSKVAPTFNIPRLTFYRAFVASISRLYRFICLLTELYIAAETHMQITLTTHSFFVVKHIKLSRNVSDMASWIIISISEGTQFYSWSHVSLIVCKNSNHLRFDYKTFSYEKINQ